MQTPAKVHHHQIKSHACMIQCYALQWKMLKLITQSKQNMLDIWSRLCDHMLEVIKFFPAKLLCVCYQENLLFSLWFLATTAILSQTCHSLETFILVSTCKLKHQTATLDAQFCVVAWRPKKIKIDWCAVELLQKNSLFIFLQHSHNLKASELQGLHWFVSQSSVCQHWPCKSPASTYLLMICGVSKSAALFSKYCHFQLNSNFEPLCCNYCCVATPVVMLLAAWSCTTSIQGVSVRECYKPKASKDGDH